MVEAYCNDGSCVLTRRGKKHPAHVGAPQSIEKFDRKEILENSVLDSIQCRRKNFSIIALIVGGTALAGVCLGVKNLMVTLDGNLTDLTNVFTFAIEIGIGVFISTVIFLYSKHQQNRSELILKNIKEVNDDLQKERTIKTEIYQKALLGCFSDIWQKCKLIMMNLDLYHAGEDLRKDPTILEKNKALADIITMNKIQLSLDLQELDTLALLSASVMDSQLVTLLII